MGKSNDNNAKTKNVSRRSLLGGAAAASVLPLLKAQQAPPATPAPAAAPRVVQGGTGPIRVLFITKFHPFDRENLFATLDGLGKEITWTHVEHPAAEAFFDPKLAASYDVFLFYDAYTGRFNKTNADGTTSIDYAEPSGELRANFKKLLQNGDKGLVFFHHAIASWVHTWPEYVEVMGAAADWGTPLKGIRGKDYPPSGAKQKTKQHVTVVDKTHPITQGVTDFDIVDETYLCPMFEDSVHCILRTDFKPTADQFNARVAGHPPGSTMAGWVKTAERTPVAYVQFGHDIEAWSNPAFQKLLLNSIKWTASKEAKDWAHANPKKIFS